MPDQDIAVAAPEVPAVPAKPAPGQPDPRILQQVEQAAGIMPKPEAAPEAAPEETPSWNDVKASDVYKGATDEERATILQKYAQDAFRKVQETTQDPAELKQAEDHLTQFRDHEAVAGMERYSLPENVFRTFIHGAGAETAQLGKELYEAGIAPLGGIRGEKWFGQEPGVRSDQTDIPKLSVDEAQKELPVAQDKLKEIQAKAAAADEYWKAKQEHPSYDPKSLPHADLFPNEMDDVVKAKRSLTLQQQRVQTLQDYISSKGDPNVVPQPQRNLYDVLAKPAEKAAKWTEKNFLPPDKAFELEHPILHTALDSVGRAIPFIAATAGVTAVTGGAGLAPETAEVIGTLTDTAMQSVDMYSNAYESSLAKIDQRIKGGEDISPMQREQMARNNASMQVFGVPLMVFSNMLVSRVMTEGNLSQDAAQGLVNRFTKNVLFEGGKEMAGQVGIATGVNAYNALAEGISGVSQEGITPQTLPESLAQGVGYGFLGMAARGTRAFHEYHADQRAVDNYASLVRGQAKERLATEPGLADKDAHEIAIRQLPARFQDAVRAKVSLQEGAQAESEAAVNLDAAKSPQTAEASAKNAQETAKQATAPIPDLEQHVAEQARLAAEGAVEKYRQEREAERAAKEAKKAPEVTPPVPTEGAAPPPPTPTPPTEEARPETQAAKELKAKQAAETVAQAGELPPEGAPPGAAREGTPPETVTPPTGAPPPPTPPAETPAAPAAAPDPWMATRRKLVDYFGDKPTKEEKLNLADDFHVLAIDSGDPAQMQAAKLLMHRLGIDRQPEEHPDWEKITPEQQLATLAVFNRFLDDKIASEGKLREKPVVSPVIKESEFRNSFLKTNNWRSLHDQLMSGRTLTLPTEAIENEPEVDSFIADHGFETKEVGPNREDTVIGPIKDEPGSWDRLKDDVEKYQAYQQAYARKITKAKTSAYSAHETSPEYQEETNKLSEHPAENALISLATPRIEDAFEGYVDGSEMSSATESKYQRQLRNWATALIRAGRTDDLNKMSERAQLEHSNTLLDPEDPQATINQARIDQLADEIKQTKANRAVVDPNTGRIIAQEPTALTKIIDSVRTDYERKMGRRPAKTSLETPVGEEGGPTIGETFAAKGQARPVDREQESTRVSHLDTNHQEAVAEFIKQKVRTNREKVLAWHIANKLSQLFDGPELERPKHIAEAPTHASKKLLTRITDEYSRFLEDRARPAGEGGEEGRAPAAAAAGGGIISPTGAEEIARGAGPEHLAGGGESDNAAAYQSSAPAVKDSGSVAEREPTAGPSRDTATGLPERTSEEPPGTLGAETQFLSDVRARERATDESRAERSGAPGAGRVRRDAATGERIIVTPEGAERGRSAPRITAEEEARFKELTGALVNRTANSIWKEWQTRKGESEQGRLLGLFQKDFASRNELADYLRGTINGQVKQEPTFQGRMRIARDTLLNLPRLRGEQSASEIRRARVYAEQTQPVTTAEQVNRINQESYNRFASGFASLGIAREVRPGRAYGASDAVTPLPDGTLILQHSPAFYENLVQLHPTEGQMRRMSEAVLQEELIHGAHLAWYREQWRAAGGVNGPVRNFKDFADRRSADLLNGFVEARAKAYNRGDVQTGRALDKTISSAIKGYFGWVPGARDVNSWHDFTRWVDGIKDSDLQDQINNQLPYELARQLVQLDVFGNHTGYAYRSLLGKLHDWFMDALRYMRRMSLRIKEGAMGPAWKDTINTLEKRVNDLRTMMDVNEPTRTPAVHLQQESMDIAHKLGAHFLDDPKAATSYGLRFDDAEHAPDYASKIIAKANAQRGSNPILINAQLKYIARKEGLLDPTRELGQPVSVGRMASLAPGVGEAHVLDEGKTHRLARFFRNSPDPEMRNFAKSLTAHRDRLMGVNIRQLKHDVPAVFYHNGDVWVTDSAMRHPDGTKAIANELQHAIAQEMITKANTPLEHEAAAHLLSLVDEFKSRLPADIRDAVDTTDTFSRLKGTGRLDLTHVNDKQRRWLPLMEAASDPTEFVKKAFSSANFRDYLRSIRSHRGDPLWDNVHDWGRTIFGEQAFKYAPESSDISHNRPGTVMRFDPRGPTDMDDMRPVQGDYYREHIEPIVRKYGLEKGATEAMRRVNLLSEDVQHKQLANALSEVLEKNPDIKIDLSGVGRGAYDFSGDEIKLRPDMVDSNHGLEQTLLHETIHALTSGKLSAYLTGRLDLLSKEDQKAVGTLEQLRRLAILHSDVPEQIRRIANLDTYDKRVRAFQRLTGGTTIWGVDAHPEFDKYYGLIDLHEFASEALSHGEFQKFLDKVPGGRLAEEAKPRSILGKFYNWLQSFLGFKPRYGLDVALRNISKIMEGRRLMTSDFRLADTTGDKTPRMQQHDLEARHLEIRARMEGYSKVSDVPGPTLQHWLNDYRDQMNYAQGVDPTKPQVINAPERRSIIKPSDKLQKMTDPLDILDHVAKVTGIDHHDSKGLARAIDNAHLDGAISTDQYLSLQDHLKELRYGTLNAVPIAGDPKDPNSLHRILDHFWKQFIPEGSLPKELHRMQQAYIDQANAALEFKLGKYVKQFNKLITKHYGVDYLHIPARLNEVLNKVLAGEFKSVAPSGMPLEVYSHIMDGRSMIDQYTDDMIRHGIIKPDTDLYREFIDNRGKYVALSYRMFNDPRWIESQASKQFWAASIAPMKEHWIRLEAHEAGDRAARVHRAGTSAAESARWRAFLAAQDRLRDVITDPMVEQHMNELLSHYRQTAEGIQHPGRTYGPAFVLNDRLLHEVTTLPEPFKQLMGKETDVRKNLVNTLFRQQRYLSTALLANKMYETGHGKYFNDAVDRNNNFTHQIDPRAEHFGVLAGKWTSKDIYDVLNGYDKLLFQEPEGFSYLLNKLESGARYNTTIVSMRRGVANIWSGMFSMLQNGMLPLDPRVSRALATEWHYVWGTGGEAIQDRIQEAIRYGLIDKTADQAILSDMVKRGFKYAESGRGYLDMLEAADETVNKNPIWTRSKLGYNAAKQWAQRFHGAGNDFAKLAQWTVKQKFLRDVDNENLRIGKTQTPKSDDDIKREAADLVRETNISYSLASPALRKVRRQQIIGTFLTFWNEALRAQAMQIGTAVKYLKGNSVERTEGIRRLAGIATAWSLAPILSAVTMKMFGVTPREDEDLKSLLPPWEQNNTRLYGPKTEDGKRQYINMNYIEPHGDIARALTAALTPNQDGIPGQVFDSVTELAHPSFSLGIMPGALVDTLRNQTEYGTQVYNPEDDLLSRGGDITKYLWGRYAGGTYARGVRQLQNLGSVTKGGNVYDPIGTISSEFLGQDFHEVSIPDRFRSAVYGTHNDLENAQRIFNGAIQRTGNIMTDDAMAATYQHMERVRWVVFQNLRKQIEAARSSGVTTSQIRSTLKERKYSRELIDDLLSGRYHAYRPGKHVLENAREVGNQVPTSLFSREARIVPEEEED